MQQKKNNQDSSLECRSGASRAHPTGGVQTLKFTTEVPQILQL